MYWSLLLFPALLFDNTKSLLLLVGEDEPIGVEEPAGSDQNCPLGTVFS
jgi:hypothetical protein